MGDLKGVPFRDLVGGSEGRRRPGDVIPVEPGVSMTRGNFFASVTAPIAVVRNRVKSVSDYRNGAHGDAAFADFTINATVAWRF